MTGGAVCAKQPGVKSRLGMAGNTGCRQPFELPAAVAALARQPNMCTCQREIAAVMVKRGILPTRGVVAGSTVGSKLPVVFIVLFVAGIAVCGRAFVHIV